MNAEQSLEALPQGGIIGASVFQINVTLGGRQFQCGTKEGHFPIGWWVHEQNFTGGNRGNGFNFRIAWPIRFIILPFFALAFRFSG
jgi:hypothetical protein